LRASLERYRSFIEVTGELGCTTNADGEIAEDIPSFRNFTGQTYEEITGWGWLKALHPDDLERTARVWKEATETKSKYEVEYRLRRHDGVYRYFLARGVPVLKEDGSIREWVGTCIDITEHKMAEDALRKSENKSRTLLENLPQKIFFKDRNSVYISCNENYSRDLEIHPDEITGKTDYDFYPRKLAEKYRADDKRIMESGNTEDIEESYTPDGQKVFVHTIKTPVKEENGNVVGILGVFWDITERKKAEEALRESEEKLENIFAASPDAITVTDLNGNIVDCNQATLDLHGYQSREDMIGKNSLEFIAKKDHEAAMQSLKKTLEHGSAKNVEYTFLTKDGREFSGELSASAVRDASGKPEYFVGITKDITKRKNMEKQLKEYSEHLEEKVEERTNQLKEAQEQLLKTEKLAAIGEVAAIVGHDLRNPLQVITNALYLSGKKSKFISITEKEILEKHGFFDLRSGLKEQVEYMDKIVSDLQDYARPMKPMPVEIGLHQLIKKTLSSLIVPENVRVSIVIEEGFPKLMLDPILMQRVFSNLITNAVQAMRDGGQLTIRASKKGETALISVEDAGVGIPDENLSKLFTPLFTTKAKGQGFGLPVCKRMMEVHGGTITVKSKGGKGSTFTVEIPLRKEVS
jgi:PAS domain S-box-containing protein